MHFVLIFSKLGWGDPGRMGHHFVPQRYLRNFEDPNQPDYIWVHDRRGGPAKLASIAKLAQSRNFYSQQRRFSRRRSSSLRILFSKSSRLINPLTPPSASTSRITSAS
jgi:hypothetical protein